METVTGSAEMSSASCSGNRRRKNTAGRNFTGSQKKSLHMLPGASYGSALIEEQESISDTKARADANMYANKKHGNRQGDRGG